MVPSSAIAIGGDGEHLTCDGFSLGETVHLGNFEFIADYFGGLSLSHRRGDEGTTFMGSTRSGASTPWRAMIEDSAEGFLTASSGEGSFGLPSSRRCSAGRRGARSHRNLTMDGECSGHTGHDGGSPTDGGIAARNQPRRRVTPCLSQRAVGVNLCSVSYHRVGGSATMKQVHWQAARYHSPTTRTVVAGAHA
jgi:hypothetical protein